MSLKWYKGAVLDETQEAYGKTWRVDKIENDGAIVFRCGKETAVAPRTDQELINPCKQIDLAAEAVISHWQSTKAKFAAIDFAAIERKIAQTSGLANAEQRYGYYSLKARSVAGLVRYNRTDGSIVDVTCVAGKDYVSGWDDQICLGPVTTFVKRIEEGSNRQWRMEMPKNWWSR